jgi:hypothetical protein
MFDRDPAIAAKAKQLYDSAHGSDPDARERDFCPHCFEGCEKPVYYTATVAKQTEQRDEAATRAAQRWMAVQLQKALDVEVDLLFNPMGSGPVVDITPIPENKICQSK